MINYRNNSLYREEIDIDVTKGVSIHLSKEEYLKFINRLLPELQYEINNFAQREIGVNKKIKEYNEAVKKLRNIFYDESEDYCFKKDYRSIDLNKLEMLLNSEPLSL